MAFSCRTVVQLRAGTDGDATHVPNAGRFQQLDPPTLYLEKLGDQWMQSRGEVKPGVKYILAGLPAGYTLWQRPRPKDRTHLDKYLYGHPSRKVFDSPNRFFVHFKHLMDHGDSVGCQCTVCTGSSGVLPKSSNKVPSARGASSSTSSRPSSSNGPAHPSTTTIQPRAAQNAAPFSAVPALASAPPKVSVPVQAESARPQGRPKLMGPGMDASRVDEEGTPDMWCNLVNKLRRHNRVDEVVEQLFSMDWRVEQELLPELLSKIKRSPQWMPRVGEIVLFVRTLPKDVHIIRHPINGDYRMYDDSTKLWLERPTWEAGLVGQTPTETIIIKDLSTNGDKEGTVTNFGVRVEPLPDVNSLDKSISKRYKYVPVRQIRPFVLWKQLLNQVTEWHPTIRNALAVTSVFSLTGKYRFRGTWPEASVYCRGIYVGHEMLAVGDTVRLSPNTTFDQTTCTDILVINSIRLRLFNLDKASENDWDEARLYNSNVWVHGTAFTSDVDRVNKEWLSDADPPALAQDYSEEWYPLHPPDKELAVPFSRIIGRLHEREAMHIWLDSRPSDNNALLLDAGREALVESRMFSQAHNKHIAREPGANWHWGDHRAQSLDLHTINGLDVSSRNNERDTKDWRRKLKTLPGMGDKKVLPAAQPAGAAGLAGRNLRGFMAPALPDSPVRAQASAFRSLRAASVSSDLSTLGTEEGAAIQAGRKRPADIVELSSEEEDESEQDEINKEIQQTMRVVSNGDKKGPKRPRVKVVVE